MRKKRRGVGPLRFVAGTVAIGAWSAGTVFLARHFGVWGGVVAGALFTVPLCSLGEWLVHGVLYHGRIPGLEFIRTIHHHGHHFALFPPAKYVQSGKYEFMTFRAPLTPFRMSDNAVDNFLTKWSQIALHFVTGIPLILVPAWFAAYSVPFLISCLVTLALISWLLGYVHGVIHTPRDRWVEHQRWFQWLDRHHYIHHIDLKANINFGLPICDFLFGTQKWELTEKEAAAHPSFEEAKPMAKDIPAIAEPAAAE
ncbi:MAG: hypothetical protein ACXVEF_31735 [Polyangiales bacterium]